MKRLILGGAILLAACGDNITASSKPSDAGIDGMFACGNGVIDTNEDCDDGEANGGPGARCDTMCHWVCLDDSWCTDMEPCNGAETCVEHRCVAGTDLADGTTCGTGKLCRNAACTDGVCGDNFVTPPAEECDDANSTSGDGCDIDCMFSCVSTDPSRDCTPTDPCAGQGTCNDTTHICSAGTPLADNTPCGTGRICKSGACTLATCGDGSVTAPETCEPPNTATCDANCQSIVCGDGVRRGPEECDDGNTTNLDACDGRCKFEQSHRVNSLSIVFPPNNTNMYCMMNALGGAIIGGTAQNQVGAALTSGVNDGSITVMMKALGLDDLSGTNDPQLSLGVLTGTPVSGPGYMGSADLDWWYTTAASVIDSMRNPTTQINASIMAKVLNAGPSNISIAISLAGMPATLDMLGAKLRGNIGAASTPLASTGSTPGHLASENLSPSLTSYATVTGGELCGNVTAQSLANVAAPSALVGCGLTSCSQCYTASHTLLDIVVSGCNTIIGQQIRPTQPDGARMAGDVYVFTTAMRRVTGCTRNGQPATLSNCLRDATYSSFMRFTTDRVIAK